MKRVTSLRKFLPVVADRRRLFRNFRVEWIWKRFCVESRFRM
jgi:hypothetical protein